MIERITQRSFLFALFIILSLGGWLTVSAYLNRPLLAQGSSLDATLAKAAVKGYLRSITDPAIDSAAFYLTDEAAASPAVAALAELTIDDYDITDSRKIDDNTFQVVVLLQPGNEEVVIDVIRKMGRWRINAVGGRDSLLPAAETAATVETTASETTTGADTNQARVRIIGAGFGLNVRSGPGVSNAVITFLPADAIVPILAQDPSTGWLQVQLPNGGSGWISGSPDFVERLGPAAATADTSSPTPPQAAAPQNGPNATILGIGLNVRSGPGIDNPIITSLNGGQTVPILNEDPATGWLQVQLPGGGSGWISGGLGFVQRSGLVAQTSPTVPSAPQVAATTPVQAEAQAVTTHSGPSATILGLGLNVRSGPGIANPVIATLEAGQTVPVLQEDPGGWLEVQLPDGSRGWVNGGPNFVQRSDLVTQASPPAPSQTSAPSATPVIAATPANSYLLIQEKAGGGIYVINPDGSGLRLLTTGVDPVPSPDGSRVAYIRWEDPWGLFTINLDGSEMKNWRAEQNLKSPTWTANGRYLIYSYQSGGTLETIETCEPLVTFEEGGTKPVPVSIPPRATDIKIDAQRGEVCYKVPPDAYWRLGQIDLNTGEYLDLPSLLYNHTPTAHPSDPNRIMINGGAGLTWLDLDTATYQSITNERGDRQPAISPDGARIAVSYWQNDHWEIHTMNSDGSNRRRLTDTALTAIVTENRVWNNAAPAWSPDGSLIAFITDRTGEWEVWVMNADGSSQHPLFPAGTLDSLDLEYNGVDEKMISWY